jgi:hypothetical protein
VARSNARVIVNILTKLGAFDAGLYPKEWAEHWGQEKLIWREPLGFNKVQVTLLVGVVAFITIWLPIVELGSDHGT